MAGQTVARFLARAVMALGLLVGVLAIGAWALDIQLQVPAWMWRVAVVKLGLVAAGGMIAAGALLQRYINRSQYAGDRPDESPRELGAPIWPASTRPREHAPQPITTPPAPPTP
jgi:hypothetical protein